MSDAIEQPQPTPADPEAVKALLANSPENEPEKATPLNLDSEAQKDLIEGLPSNPADVTPRIETPVDPTFDPRTPNNGNLMAWALRAPDIGEVRVSDLEKDLYLKAVMNDAEVRFEVEFPLAGQKATVLLRTLSNYELDVMFAALAGDEVSGRIKDPAQYTGLLQQYAAVMQVASINAKPFEMVTFQPAPLSQLKADADALRDRCQELVGRTNFVRWSLLLSALCIFSIKIKICNDALANQDFWKPADID